MSIMNYSLMHQHVTCVTQGPFGCWDCLSSVLVLCIIIVLCIAIVLVLFGILKAISISWSSILERKRINWMMFGKQYVLDETFSKFALTFLCLIQDFKYQLTSAIHLLTDTIFRKGNCLTIISTVYFRYTASTAKI